MAETLETAQRLLSSLVNVAYGPGAVQFSDEQLLPYLQTGLRWAIAKLQEEGVTQTRARCEFIVPANSQGTGVAASLPSDFVRPVMLWEQMHDDTGTWRMLTLTRDHIPPNWTPDNQLIWYDFVNDVLTFPGVTNDVLVRMDYVANVADMNMPGDEFPYLNLKDAVAFYAASIACAAAGRDDAAQTYEDIAEKRIQQVINFDAQFRQGRPYRRHRRRFGLPEWRS